MLYLSHNRKSYTPVKERTYIMENINCLGDMCPLPLLKLQQCKELSKKGETIKLVTDHSCSVESITEFCQKNNLNIEITEPMNGIWELFISLK